MNLKYIVTTISLLATGMMVSGAPAQAFSFTTNFSGTTNSQGKLDPTRDIMLNSVTLTNGQTIKNFALLNQLISFRMIPGQVGTREPPVQIKEIMPRV
jgi:hypothetical protein